MQRIRHLYEGVNTYMHRDVLGCTAVNERGPGMLAVREMEWGRVMSPRRVTLGLRGGLPHVERCHPTTRHAPDRLPRETAIVEGG